jgi:hypothetical protein
MPDSGIELVPFDVSVKRDKQWSVVMRLLGVAVISLMSLSGAFAQQPPNNGSPSKEYTQADAMKEHPDWFSEQNTYRPCPAEVTFHGRITCLGGGGE